MKYTKYGDQIVDVEEFRSLVPDYHVLKIYPTCLECGAPAAPRGDGEIPYDPKSLFPSAAKRVTAHFSHFPGQADPDCRYVNPSLDRRDYALTSGIERSNDELKNARRQFVTEDGRIKHGGYVAGYMMARMLGKNKLAESYQFFDDERRMLELGLIPPASHKLWRRKAPAWARPFAWMLFHDFPVIGRKGEYKVQFKLNGPEDSILDAQGNWHGKPAYLTKVFKDTGKELTDPQTGKPIIYEVTRENALQMVKEAMHWGSTRPFSHIEPERIRLDSLFPDTPKLAA